MCFVTLQKRFSKKKMMINHIFDTTMETFIHRLTFASYHSVSFYLKVENLNYMNYNIRLSLCERFMIVLLHGAVNVNK